MQSMRMCVTGNRKYLTLNKKQDLKLKFKR